MSKLIEASYLVSALFTLVGMGVGFWMMKKSDDSKQQKRLLFSLVFAGVLSFGFLVGSDWISESYASDLVQIELSSGVTLLDAPIFESVNSVLLGLRSTLVLLAIPLISVAFPALTARQNYFMVKILAASMAILSYKFLAATIVKETVKVFDTSTLHPSFLTSAILIVTSVMVYVTYRLAQAVIVLEFTEPKTIHAYS